MHDGWKENGVGLDAGERVRIYRVIVDLECATCGGTISKWEHCRVIEDKPYCDACAPFEFEEVTEQMEWEKLLGEFQDDLLAYGRIRQAAFYLDRCPKDQKGHLADHIAMTVAVKYSMHRARKG